MSEKFSPVSIKDAAKLILGKRALILCHINPDGDALGSATALAELLRLTGGDGRVVTPSAVPARLSFIIGDEDTEYTSEMEDQFDLVLSVDTASPSQLGELCFLAEKVALSFDHHESCTLYSPYVLYSGSAAAGLVIYDLLCELESMGAVSDDPAPVLRRIYAAIASDTGSFKFANTSPEAFGVASDICRRLKNSPLGGDVPIDTMSTSDISAALFDSITKKDVLVRRVSYDNLRYICEGRIALSVMTSLELSENGLVLEDCGAMVDHVRSIEGTIAGVVLKQSPDDPRLFRGSARANCDFDVSAVAVKLGGGGHRRAAGFRVNAKSVEEAVEIVERMFGEALSGMSEVDNG